MALLTNYARLILEKKRRADEKYSDSLKEIADSQSKELAINSICLQSPKEDNWKELYNIFYENGTSPNTFELDSVMKDLQIYIKKNNLDMGLEDTLANLISMHLRLISLEENFIDC